jgi:hypothetical protein
MEYLQGSQDSTTSFLQYVAKKPDTSFRKSGLKKHCKIKRAEIVRPNSLIFAEKPPTINLREVPSDLELIEIGNLNSIFLLF